MSDAGISQMPSWTEEFSSSEVMINFVDNIGPYRKLNPILDKIDENDLLVTCDDDVIYDRYWLAELVDCAKKNPGSIVCSKARKIEKGFLGRNKSYLFWSFYSQKSDVPMHDLLPIGQGGILYRKNLIDTGFIMDDAFRTIAPLQDDLWYRHASILKKTPVFVCPEARQHVYPLALAEGLHMQNLTICRASDTMLRRHLKKVYKYGVGYLGFPIVKNDFAWMRIKKYIKSRGF